ncbi:MAG: class II aldolase/adducin family protein [Deltaproteobacteria bacterium]|nr:class II aldolase/adducin family protein [Deltaproteobacteria bacterium]MDQ3296742.1 class II aldolase/adducin family protein [Myxococcota bacterium]
MTMRLRDELVTTARQMSALGLTPGMSGNVSVRSAAGLLVTPSGMPYGELVADDVVELKLDGTLRPGQRTPTTEWQLHRDILGARQDIQAIVHTHSLFCTTLSMLRRAIPAVHYMVVLAGSDEIPCAEYATFGSAELALNAVSALRGGSACLLANHGMVALGPSLPAALRLAAEVETLASQYWHAAQLGTPHVLGHDELEQVRARFAEYGQQPRARRSW